MDNYIQRGEHEEFVKRIKDEERRQNRRLEILEESVKQFTDLTLSVGNLANSMKQMVEEQKEQGKRLEKLEDVPVKNWNTVKVAILTAVGTAVGTGIVAAVINTI